MPHADGAVTVRFRTEDGGEPNTVIVPEGWNLLVRLYRPRPAAFDGSWRVPELVPVG